jgi:1-deoxy-D-xylulose-5-phosphate synthase
MTPSSAEELRNMLFTGYEYPGLAAVRYPRGSVPAHAVENITPLEIGKSKTLKQGRKVALLNFGPLLETTKAIAEQNNYTVVDMRFVKPLDADLIRQLSDSHDLLVSIEDHSLKGGAGSAVSEYLHQNNIHTPLLMLGIPDKWIEHATRQQQLEMCGLDQSGIQRAIETALNP